MQAVPSVVGSGTAIAAAAVGLVFGQPPEPTRSQPPSSRRRLFSDDDAHRGLHASSRPGTGTSSGARALPAGESPLASSMLQPPQSSPANTTRPPRTQTATTSQLTPPKITSRRQSFARPNELAPPSIAENARDSVSSNGSWMRRLSIRPLSQHGSPRSSVGPDSPSLTFSYGSGAAILAHSVSSTPPQLPPNKLVKRTTTTTATPPSATSTRSSHTGSLSRRGSRSQMPSLRRPATSHQRSATLQQAQGQAAPGLPTGPKYSLDQHIRPSLPSRTPLEIPEGRPRPGQRRWTSFFHSRVVSSTSSGSSSARGSDGGSPAHSQLPGRTIRTMGGSTPRAYLVNASMMTAVSARPASPSSSPPAAAAASPSPLAAATAVGAGGAIDADSRRRAPEELPQANSSPSAVEEKTPSKTPRRTISMHFSSPSSWISRGGSIRRQKRGSESKSGGVRNVSAPVGATLPIMAQGHVKQDLQQIFAPPDLDKREGALTLDGSASIQPRSTTRQRNSSSPLPPLSRLSSFNLDLYRLGASASSAPHRHQQQPDVLQASPVLASPQGFSIAPHSRDVSNERASTLAGSDLDMRAFMSGDDDDTDFKSDTMFDSIRTTGSGRIRNVDTPLESMFDESPPSTAGNSKTKRLSIQEILGRSWDGDTRIMEEDEGAPTPIRRGATSSRANAQCGFAADEPLARESFDYENQVSNFALAGRDFGRLSLDDDDDYDWARDEENGLCNHLSPPSSSIHSRGASPNLRLALASISGNGSPVESSQPNDAASERPRSTVFDWSEPPSHERFDVDGPSPRPKTVHGKQETDVRGGRAATRKGLPVAHVRSQSVPVVHEPSESNKAAGKFRTWASGPKNASEDWEEDFDFDEGAGGLQKGLNSAASFSMVVPASIQATQPTVKAHSGQIRELSLLVNGLKRLCRHGRDLHLWSESPELWKEAENIIELASPDEEAEDTTETRDDGSTDFDPALIEERFLDEGFDGVALGRLDDPFDAVEPAMSKTAVVRERSGARRRSVFSPEDDIFGGGWPQSEEPAKLASSTAVPPRPETPERHRETDAPDSAMITSVMEAMQQQRRSSSAPIRSSAVKPSSSKLFFDTNSLQELVKRANSLFHSLSDLVRRAELITQSPAGTPTRRHLRRDGSPAFTRVFTDPAAGPPGSPAPLPPTTPMRLPKSHSTNSVLSRASIESRTSNGIGQRMQVMIVN